MTASQLAVCGDLSVSHGPCIGGTKLVIKLSAPPIYEGAGAFVKLVDCFRGTSQTVSAEFDARSNRVTCRTPPWKLLAPSVEVAIQISIDGGKSYSSNSSDTEPHLRFWGSNSTKVTKAATFEYYMTPRVTNRSGDDATFTIFCLLTGSIFATCLGACGRRHAYHNCRTPP